VIPQTNPADWMQRSAHQSRQIQEKAQDYSGFGLKPQTPTLKSAQLSLAPARAAGRRISPDDLTHHCDIIETGNDSWRFKSRGEDHQTTRARAVSATPASSDGANATVRTRRSKGSLLDANLGSRLDAD
jgi:hypothetical protein